MYPALAVLQAATELSSENLLWVGSDDGMESELVQRAGVKFVGIPSAGVHGVNLFSLPGRVVKLCRGYRASRRILKEFRPDVLFFTGGYVGFPMAAAGRSLPSVLFVPDIEPGMALNQLAKTASVISLACEDSRRFFPAEKNTVVTGYPVRADLRKWASEEARDFFGLKEGLPTLFVFGGSKGARSINRALAANLSQLLPYCQIIHVTGRLDWDEIQSVRSGLEADLAESYHIYPYLHEEMGAAFTIADLVISRAGASTLGEFPLFGIPAILVPYPYAWRYQKVNAEYLIEKDAALMIEDQNLEDNMCAIVLSLFREPQRLDAMRKNMAALAKPDAAAEISRLLEESAAAHK